MIHKWMFVPAALTSLLLSGVVNTHESVLVGEDLQQMSSLDSPWIKTPLLAQELAPLTSEEEEELEALDPAVHQVVDRLRAEIVVLEEFVLQHSDVFGVTDPTLFEIRNPETFQQMAIPVRALDDLQLVTRALIHPDHVVDGVTLLSAIDDSLKYFPDFVRSDAFISAYEQLNEEDKSRVSIAVKELADALKVMRRVTIATLAGEELDLETEGEQLLEDFEEIESGEQ